MSDKKEKAAEKRAKAKAELDQKVLEAKEKMKDRVKVPFFRSISIRITGFVVMAVVLVAGILMVTIVPMTKKETLSVIESYLQDQVSISAMVIDNAKTLQGETTTLSSEYLSSVLGAVQISDYESSYAYAVSADGTMLYHPTADKIGQPVENAQILKIVDALSAGNFIQDGFVTYEYNGVTKYAAYSMACDQKCIVVITADESDVLKGVTALQTNIILIALGLLVVMSVLVVFASRKLMDPIVKITNAIFRLSNLDLRVDAYTLKMKNRKDEMGYMSRGVIQLNENLVRFITEIREQSTTLYHTSEELAKNASDTVNSVRQVEFAVNEVAEGAGSQAQETAEATSNVIVMGDMIEGTNQEVEKLKLSSKEIEKAADEAKNILNELLRINGKATDSIDIIYERTNTTNHSVEEIKKAISLITSIAEETNLLSLNASIEAARAGEQGRGFAVVAAQISKLAEQSSASAKQIEAITEKLITDSQKAVSGMQDVKTIMINQTEHVHSTTSAFDKVRANIDTTLEGLNEISNRTEQLDATRGMVTDTVQNLSAIAEENAASTQESSASVSEVCNIMDKVTADTLRLKDISQVIDGQLHEFKIEE